jgi:opacity protein-like surface antigen
MTLLASIEDNDPAYYTQYGPYYALTAHDGSVGGHAGVNRQFGIWVAGLEADAALQTEKIIYGDHFYAKQPWSASVRARLGILARPNVLLYATAGVAATHLEYSEAVFNPSIGYEGQIFNDTGLQVGGGVEAFFSRHLSMRVEGLYTRYGVHKITEDGDPNWIIEPHTLEARAGLSYHFN